MKDIFISAIWIHEGTFIELIFLLMSSKVQILKDSDYKPVFFHLLRKCVISNPLLTVYLYKYGCYEVPYGDASFILGEMRE